MKAPYSFRETNLETTMRRKGAFLIINLFTHGYLGQEETLRRHGENQGQGYKTGVDCAALPIFARLPLSQEREGVAGHAGHRVAQV